MEIESENYPLAVVGAGTMGRGIAQVAALAGHPVMLYDVSEKHIYDAIEFIGQRLEYSFQRGKIRENTKLQVIKNIKPIHELNELKKAKLI
jgi:3-hydroxyacyl-CoA dehydrogenase